MNKSHNRREFLALAAAAGAAGLARPLFGDVPPRANKGMPSMVDENEDLLVFNANIYTMDESMPRAEAFAVQGGRFVAVGSSSEIRGLATRRTHALDARRMTI